MSDRRPMLLGATIMTVGLAVGAAVGLFGQATEWPFFLLTLFVIGVGRSVNVCLSCSLASVILGFELLILFLFRDDYLLKLAHLSLQ